MENPSSIVLSPPQQEAKQEIEQQFMTKEVVLLWYHRKRENGNLYQIYPTSDRKGEAGFISFAGTTTQIVNRLRKYFGDKIGVYHSGSMSTSVWKFGTEF